MIERTLYRSCKDKVLGGVAGGVAEYFDFDPSLTRLIFAIVILTTGFGFLAYILAWIVVPLDPSCNSKQTGAEEIKEKAEQVASDIRNVANGKNVSYNDIMVWVGVLILSLGLLFLAQSIFGIQVFRVFWPVWLVIIGAIILSNSINRK